jgi:asparagine synthase (glutamine-hydrolysing)
MGAPAVAWGLLAGPQRVERALALGYDTLPRALARRYRRTRANPYASREAIEQAACFEPPRVQERAPMRRELLREAFHTSLPGLLRFADRDSMAHSRELRLPFLDRRVAEFALSLPPSFLYRDGTTKRVLRDAVAGIVPVAVIAKREKVRFETPEQTWFATADFKQRVRDVVLDRSARWEVLYDRAAIEADLRAGTWRSAPAIWRVLNVELWSSAFAARRPVQAGAGAR